LRVNGSHAGGPALSIKARVMLGGQEAANSSGQLVAHRSGQEVAKSSGQLAALRSGQEAAKSSGQEASNSSGQDAIHSSRGFDTALNIRHSQLPYQMLF
jgi:hypothetical protein